MANMWDIQVLGVLQVIHILNSPFLFYFYCADQDAEIFFFVANASFVPQGSSILLNVFSLNWLNELVGW